MKLLLIVSLTLGSAAFGVDYYRNDGRSLPESLEQKSNKTGQVGPTTSETGIRNSSRVTPDEINPSLNPAPSSDKELIESTTLTNPGKVPEEVMEAQEESPLDYSTTPKKKVKPSDKTDL